MSKLFCFIKLMISLVQFKIIRPKENYWTWLFSRISKSKIQKERHRCFIVFLLSDAYEHRYYDGVCDVYELVEPYMGEDWPAEKGLNIILDSAIKANRVNVKEKIEIRTKPMESDPELSPQNCDQKQ